MLWSSTRREEKMLHKKKKWKYNEDKLRDLVNLRSINENRSFYQELNKSQKDFKPRVTLCRDKNGAIISEKVMILKRWVGHFDELLNVHELELQESTIVNGIQEDTEPAPTTEEIEIAIKKLKNNKAPGIDIIQAELLRVLEFNYHMPFTQKSVCYALCIKYSLTYCLTDWFAM
jgi:hypothetical protein